MAPETRRRWANIGAAILLAVAFVVSLTGFRHPPGWIGVTHEISFNTEFQPRDFEETALDDEGWPLDRAVLDSAETLDQVDAIRDHLSRRSTSRWRHIGPTQSGGFLRERWCGPDVSVTDCQRAALAPSAHFDGEWRQLDIVRDDSPSRDVVGYLVTAWGQPGSRDAQWRLSLARGGGRVIRPSLLIDLYPVEREGRRLTIGTTYDVRIGELSCTLNAPGYRPLSGGADRATVEELGRLMESPSALRETVSQRLMMLLERADAVLDEDAPSDPACTVGQVSREEAARLRLEVHRMVEQQLDLISESAPALHAWLESVLPAEAIVADDR